MAPTDLQPERMFLMMDAGHLLGEDTALGRMWLSTEWRCNPIDLISGISSNLLCRLERLLRGRRWQPELAGG
jgi:hypothetical protein